LGNIQLTVTLSVMSTGHFFSTEPGGGQRVGSGRAHEEAGQGWSPGGYMWSPRNPRGLINETMTLYPHCMIANKILYPHCMIVNKGIIMASEHST